MGFQYIDTHAHVNLPQFAEDRDEVLARTAEAGVAHINVGTRKETSEKAVALSQAHPSAFAIIGVHPLEVIGDDPDDPQGLPPEREFDTAYYQELAQSKKVVGIGECGFDYFHHGDETHQLQADMFRAQIAFANQVQKPLMLHLRHKQGTRNAYDDALSILKDGAKVPGNAHFYAGSWEQAKQFFDMGYTISFTGVITFTHDYDEIIKNAPLDMLHAETDCPYVAPVPYRGQRNEPLHVKEVYKKIAEVKGVEEEEVRAQLLENANRLYGFSLGV